jgi:methionyl-tRNA formyltransferase
MKLIFCGTPRFALPTLEKLIEEQFDIELVVTKPDEPAGRGHELTASPVKQAAHQHRLLIFQPEKLNHPATRTFLSTFYVEAIVVAAYGYILPQWMLELAPLGCINLHASLLPKYRGAAPIPWAIIRGEKETGVTTMRLDRGMDTGDILLSRAEPIYSEDTAETLSMRLSLPGAELMVETLRGLERGAIQPCPQDNPRASYAPRLRKEDGRIDWSLESEEIWRRVRGLNPWPGAFSTFRGKLLHIWTASFACESLPGVAPGTLILAENRLEVACRVGHLILGEVQLEGRKRLSAFDFARGARIKPGEKLGI